MSHNNKITFSLPSQNTYKGSISKLVYYVDLSRHDITLTYRSWASSNMILCDTLTKLELLLAKQKMQLWGQLRTLILYLDMKLMF